MDRSRCVVCFCMCKRCIDAGDIGSLSVAVDGGKWFEKKLHDHCTKSDVPSQFNQHASFLTTTGFKTFPSTNIPKLFNHGHIFHHVVESVQMITAEGEQEAIQMTVTLKWQMYIQPSRFGKVKLCLPVVTFKMSWTITFSRVRWNHHINPRPSTMWLWPYQLQAVLLSMLPAHAKHRRWVDALMYVLCFSPCLIELKTLVQKVSHVPARLAHGM